MTTKMKIVVSGLALTFLSVLGVVANAAGAGSTPAQPFRQPTPIPAKPHAEGQLVAPASVGFPKS